MRAIHELMDGTRRNEWDFRNASRLPKKQGTADNQTGASDWLRRADPCPVDRGCVASADKPMTARVRLRTTNLRSASANQPIQYYWIPNQYEGSEAE